MTEALELSAGTTPGDSISPGEGGSGFPQAALPHGWHFQTAPPKLIQ